jgi:hypothetical protein
MMMVVDRGKSLWYITLHSDAYVYAFLEQILPYFGCKTE